MVILGPKFLYTPLGMKGFRWITAASELSDRICETPYNVARVTTKYFMSPEWNAYARILASNLFFISHKEEDRR